MKNAENWGRVVESGGTGEKWWKVGKSDEKWLRVGKVEKSGGTW